MEFVESVSTATQSDDVWAESVRLVRLLGFPVAWIDDRQRFLDCGIPGLSSHPQTIIRIGVVPEHGGSVIHLAVIYPKLPFWKKAHSFPARELLLIQDTFYGLVAELRAIWNAPDGTGHAHLATQGSYNRKLWMRR